MARRTTGHKIKESRGKNAVFVDVANIFYAAKAAGADIDYVLLLKAATAGRDLVRAYAYTGLDPDNENQRNFHSFLARNGYKVVSKDIRKYGDGQGELDIGSSSYAERPATSVWRSSCRATATPAIAPTSSASARVISFRGNTSSDLMQSPTVHRHHPDRRRRAPAVAGASRATSDCR